MSTTQYINVDSLLSLATNANLTPEREGDLYRLRLGSVELVAHERLMVLHGATMRDALLAWGEAS